jgi:phosphoribosylformylglycinamidine cyclo-ligase
MNINASPQNPQDETVASAPAAESAYAAAGVNIEAGNEAVRLMKPHAQRTFTPGVMGTLGGFGAMFDGSFPEMREPILVSGTDGVGTKLKVAFALDVHDTIGRDLVAMCVNDVLCSGARPLFFLDYMGTGKLLPGVAAEIVKGIADGCVESGCALIGGETAELPGMYSEGEYDLAGFCVGAVDKSRLIDGSKIEIGDAILGLSSSGLHSNGYSLARKILEPLGFETHVEELGKTVGKELLTPTRLYVKPVLALMERIEIRGLVHITGGGFYENIPRILPASTRAEIQRGSWPIPPVFAAIAQRGQIAEREMFTTFNMGIGMCVVVAPQHEEAARETLREYSLEAHRIGTIVEGAQDVVLV